MTIRELKEQRDKFNLSSAKDLSAFDKNFFLVAFAVFAFTVTFIKDIVPFPQTHSLWCLILTWIFLAISLSSMIIASFLSAVHKNFIGLLINDLIDKVSEEKKVSPKLPDVPNSLNTSDLPVAVVLPETPKAPDASNVVNASDEPKVSGAPDVPDIEVVLKKEDKKKAEEIILLQSIKRTGHQYIVRLLAILFFCLGMISLCAYISWNHWPPVIDRPNSPTTTYTDSAKTVNNFASDNRSILTNNIIIRDSARARFKQDTVFVTIPGCACPPTSHRCTKKCSRRKVKLSNQHNIEKAQ